MPAKVELTFQVTVQAKNSDREAVQAAARQFLLLLAAEIVRVAAQWADE